MVHRQRLVLVGGAGAHQRDRLGVEVVVEGGMEEDLNSQNLARSSSQKTHVEEDHPVLAEGEERVHARLAVDVVAVEEVEREQQADGGAERAQHFVLEGDLA